jgi:glycosyltransferase involved in cell wall biosynthesis
MERGGKFRLAVAMVIPTLNEAEAIGPLIARVPRDIVTAIIVADGGSTDATVDCATAAGARVVAAGRGYGRACLRGAIEAGSETEIIVFMDGDGSDHPEVVATLVDPIARGSHDFVIGSRIRGQREAASMGALQVIAGRLIGAAIGALYGVTYSDMCAFRAIRRDVVLGLGMREMMYGWNLEMQMRVARAGLRVLEAPVPYDRRRAGASKVAGSTRGSLRAATHILSTFVRIATEPRPIIRTGAGVSPRNMANLDGANDQ